MSIWDVNNLNGKYSRLAVNKFLTRIFFFALLCFAWCAPSVAATWRQLESPHFKMYTTAWEKIARELLMELEGFRSLVQIFVNIEIPADAEKVKVILFKNTGDFRKYVWDSRIAGFVIPTETSAIIVQPASHWDMDTTSVIYHEYVHTLIRHYKYKIPGWYNEGLAELFGATRFVDGKFIVGVAPKDRLKGFAYGLQLAPFDDIISDKFQLHSPGIRYDPYVQYWMLAHYFVFGNKDRDEDLKFYLALYNDGMDSLKAFKLAFKITPEKFWHHELKKYYSHSRIPGYKVEIPPDKLQFPISYGDADMAEVEDNLIVLRASSANMAFQRKDYRRGRKLMLKLIDDLDTSNKNFPELINNYVWFLSTTQDDKLRDGKEAVRLGELYIKDKTDNPVYLDTLAAAYAEAGRFEEAIQIQADLVSRPGIADKNHAGYAKRLESYKNNKPWREKER